MNNWMLSEEVYHQLVSNHGKQKRVKGTSNEVDFEPVCRLWIPGTDCLWLLTELDGEIAFGGAQITMFELGSVWMPELADLDVQGLRAVLDRSFRPTTTLSGYAKMARRNGSLLLL